MNKRVRRLFFNALALGLTTLPLSSAFAETLDWLLVNGRVIDGSGGPEQNVAVASIDGRLRLFGADQDLPEARRIIDASGLVVAPGFVDPHTHARADLLSDDKNHVLNYLTQGVTTLAIGNDGDGTPNIDLRFERLAANRTGTHVIQFVGHGALRRAVMGNENREATESELQAMEAMLASAFAKGAAGLSLGLFYTPGNYAPTSEVAQLCRIAATWNRICEAHIRSESSRGLGVFAAIEEMIEIGRQSGASMHIAHIKVLGRDVWGGSARVIELIESAQKEGIKITADQYPWVASSTQLKNAILSAEWLAGSRSQWRTRLLDAQNTEAVLADLEQGIARRGGGQTLMLVATDNPQIEGLRLSEVAQQWDMTEAQTALKLLQESPPRVVSFNMSESDIANFMSRPWVATSSDGTDGHPRKYASFPRKYNQYVVKQRVLSLPQFVQRSAALPAQILGLSDRGLLADGMVSDVVVFDPDEYRDAATFQAWNTLTPGVQWLFLAGEPVIEAGRYRGARAGQNLALPSVSATVKAQ
ncbi:N-acyl-D-amino-acid deacylase family protein [Aequoribacter sp.]|uniref:N-acyl-D-amino-acid deacylase family protein n=1 Tax=Aequoribacter sp. TaxID=2847771 RepID=UPI003F696DF7